ncbi:MAG: PAS domain-containing protein [Caulobacterales bacterium]|jgi:hypothetical protein
MIGEETFHPDTRALLAYGRTLAGGTDQPVRRSRADQVLERLFIFERTQDGRWPIRTFGQDLVTVFGRDLKDHDFATLWLAPDKVLISALISAAADAGQPAIARVTASTQDGTKLGAEVLITPLRMEPAFGERFLALFQPLGGEAFLGGKPITLIRCGSLHPPVARSPLPVRLVVNND